MKAIEIAYGREVVRAAVPVSFSERLTGLRRRPGPMLFRASSVHGVGMDRTLTVVAIGRDRRVLAVRRLRPGGLVVVKGANWMLELETGAVTPAIGTHLNFYSPIDDRTSRGVRNSDRQPRRYLRAARRNAD